MYKDIPTEEIFGKHINGESIKNLASKYGVSESTIRNRIKKYKASRRKYIPKKEMLKKYMDGESLEDLASEYGVSESTIQNRIKEYKANSDKKIVRKTKTKKSKLQDVIQEYKQEKNATEDANQFDFMTLYNYHRLGFALKQIQDYAKQMGYSIKQEDINKIQKLITGELRIASEESIYNMLKCGYTYLQIMNKANKEGYLILSDRYQAALYRIRNENRKQDKKGEERDD